MCFQTRSVRTRNFMVNKKIYLYEIQSNMMKSPDGKNCPIPDAKKFLRLQWLYIFCYTNFRLKVEQKGSGKVWTF